MDKDYKLIKDKDYQTRYDACERILAKNGITKSLYEVSPKIYLALRTMELDNPEPREYEKIEEAIALLKEYVSKHGEKVDYSQYSKKELNDFLLEVSDSFSEAPNSQLIKMLLELGADWDVKDEWGRTAFFRAMHIYKLENLKIFIAHGADINDAYVHKDGDYYESVWIHCVGWAEPEEVQYMLAQGANPRAVNNRGRNALHEQCDTRGYLESLQYLLEAGVEIDALDEHQKTPLHLLCQRRSDMPEEVEYLLKKGANPNIKDHTEQTVLHRAAWVWQAKEATLQILLQYGADINVVDRDGNTPLHIAINRNNKEVTTELMKHKPNTVISNKEGKTAYQLAIEKGYVALANLINERAEEDYRNRPEFQAIKDLKEQIIAKLKAGKYYYSSDKEGYTRFLHKDGEYVSERYEQGATPPMSSSYKKDADALKWLYNTYSWRAWANKNELNIYQTILDGLR
ncbi:MAG: hypothetical protein GY810_28930 [Aureispira sp.]|nr:hypothetical protein [Aureispira sp.]